MPEIRGEIALLQVKNSMMLLNPLWQLAFRK
jgi:hypothetical protein